jgi:hypothetical protein
MRHIAAILALTSICTLAIAAPSHAVAQDGEIGITAVDATIQALQAHDIPALVAAAGFIERPCVRGGSPSAPYCPPDSPSGELVGSVVFTSCGTWNFWGPGESSIGYLFPSVLQGSASGSVFAVLRGSLTPEPAQDYIVALTPGSPASPTEDGSLWQIRVDGSIVAVADQCAPVGIVQSIERYFPHPAYEVNPDYNCDPPPGASVRAVVTVEGVYGDVNPHFWGHGTTPEGQQLTERFVVSERHAVWRGDLTDSYLLQVGMVVDVEGVRLPNCLIKAATATVSLGGVPAAPTGVSVNFVTREVTWVDNANSEQGFRADYRIAQGPEGSFIVPPNTTKFIVPGEGPLGGCGHTMIDVVAFNSAGDSAPGSYGIVADCFILDTPTARSDTNSIRLPNTGSGSPPGAADRSVWPALAALALAFGSAAMLALSLYGRGRRRGSDHA